MTTVIPRIGLRFTHPTLGNVIVEAIHPAGTIDVRNIWTDKHYRMSGLPLNMWDDGVNQIETNETQRAIV